MKKAISVLLLLSLLLAALPFASAEGDVLVSGDYSYTLSQGGEATIVKYSGSERTVQIPATLDGHRVTGIGEFAFLRNALVSVSIPESVTVIGDAAFGGCRNLTHITLPSGMEHIGHNPFSECTSLTAIDISPANPIYETREGVLFDRTRALLLSYPCAHEKTDYVVPQGTKIIGNDAFSGSETLKSVTLPEGLTTIEYEAFRFCTALDDVVLPDSLTSIGHMAFAICRSLTSLILPDSVTSLGNGICIECTSLKRARLPEGIKSVNDTFFYLCGALESIRIPSGVTSIEERAFGHCTSLREVFMPESLTTVGYGAFEYCTALPTIYLPKNVTSIEKNAFFDCVSITFIVELGSYAAEYVQTHGLHWISFIKQPQTEK